MARVLILRAAEDAAETAGELAARGHTPLILPLQRTRALREPPPVARFAAFALTSRNGVAALSRWFAGDTRPVVCVGEATAESARRAGFPAVETGTGTAERMLEAARRAVGPSGLPLLYSAGRVRTGTLEAALDAAAIPLIVWETYDTIRLDPDADAVGRALGGNAPDAVLVLSRVQAKALADVAQGAPALLERARLLCLSAGVAAALPRDLRASAEISATPRLSSLLDCLL